MTEQGQNNLPARNERKAEEFDDEFIPEGAWPICPKCLTACHPLQFYCHNCDSNEAINPLASYMPFVRIRFNAGMIGKLGWKILYDKELSITYKLFLVLMLIAAILFFPGSVC